MRIVGIVETSLIDWDGKISTVVFTAGCNFSCPFCHNHLVADDNPSLPTIPWPEIVTLLERKLGWLDAVVISGGEPLMHPELFEICHAIRRLGLRIKLDTNGSFPYVLKRLLALNMVDFIAMDVKAPFNEKYNKACGRQVDPAPLRRTIRLLLETGIPYEFRTTLVPGLVAPEDIPAIGQEVRGAQTVVLQQFNPATARSEYLQKVKPYSKETAEAMADQLRQFVNEVKLRGRFL